MILPHSDYSLTVPPLNKGARSSRMSPLKGNALAMLREEYGNIGLATAQIKQQAKKWAVRLVWVYPEHRKDRPIVYYIPFATVSFPALEAADGTIQPATIQPIHYSKLWPQLIPYFNLEHFKNAWDLFSDEGKAEVLVALRSPFNGGHPRTLLHKRRIERLKELPHLWDKPLELVDMFRREGLISPKTSREYAKWRLLALIRRLPQ